VKKFVSAILISVLAASNSYGATTKPTAKPATKSTIKPTTKSTNKTAAKSKSKISIAKKPAVKRKVYVRKKVKP
jgi:hypothetical protein